MLSDDLFGSGQADPRAGNVLLHVAATAKAVEDVRQIGGGNAQAAILDRHDSPAPVFVLFAMRVNDDISTRRTVFDGVVEHVAPDPLDARSVRECDE